MVTDLDFEELDDIMGQMEDTQSLTDAIAADVAKVSPEKKVKKPRKKPAKSKNTVKVDAKEIEKKLEKKEPKKVEVSDGDDEVVEVKQAKEEKPKAIEIVAKPKQKPESQPIQEDSSDEGTKVSVRVLTKYDEEPEEPVYKPNPRTGRFMDMIGPKNDMTVAKKQPNVIIPVTTTVIEATETVIETVEDDDYEEPVEETVVSEDDEYDRDRIEQNGLDPDATIEEMMEFSEPEDGDEYLDEVINLLGEDIEEEMEESLKKQADIIDIPDRSDIFLSEVNIEKRPLGKINEQSEPQIQEEVKEVAPEKEPIKKPVTETKLSAKEEKRLRKDIEKQAQNLQPYAKKKSRAGRVLLYILLIILLAILGGSLGALAYFSGLF